MRLIDADALEKAIYKWMPEDMETWADGPIPPIEDIVVSVMMTIEEQPTINQWIPCSERLPDNDGRSYLLNVIVPYSKYTVILACNASDVVDAYKNGWINAWMPAPEPYVPEPHKGE